MALNEKQIRAAIPEPEITIVNTGLEGSDSRDVLKQYPNFRNDGKVAVRDVVIFYILFDHIVAGIDEIVGHEKEIKKSSIKVQGSSLPGESVNLNDGKPESGIKLRKSYTSRSLIVWFTYSYLENYTSEVVFDMQFNDMHIERQPIRYTSSVIEAARARLGRE